MSVGFYLKDIYLIPHKIKKYNRVRRNMKLNKINTKNWYLYYNNIAKRRTVIIKPIYVF